MADDVGIYLKSQGIPAGGETPGAGIFLNPQGGLDTDSFSNWFTGLGPSDQDAISQAIANMAKQDAQPGAPGGPGSTNQNGTNPPFNSANPPLTGTPADQNLTGPFNSAGGPLTSVPPDTPPTPPGPFASATNTAGGGTPSTNQNPGLGNPPFVSTDQLPGVPGSPVQPGGPLGQGGNFTGVPSSTNTAGTGTQVQLGNNPPVTSQPGAPNASASASNTGVSGFTPQQLAFMQRLNSGMLALGGVGGGVGYG